VIYAARPFLTFYEETNGIEAFTHFFFEFARKKNPRKAVGVDGSSPRLLRVATPVLAEEITQLINYGILYLLGYCISILYEELRSLSKLRRRRQRERQKKKL